MRYHFFLHYGWFFQNLGKEAVRTFMHTTVFSLFTSFFQAETITALRDSNLETTSSQSGGLCNNKNLDRLENSTTISTTTKSKCLLFF